MADLLAQVIEVQNRLSAPLAPYFLGQGATCPLSITFGKHFVAYYPLWLLVLLLQWATFRYLFSHFTKGLFRKMGLTAIRAQRTTNALWLSGTALGTMMLCASQLETLNPLALTFPSSAEWPPPHLAMYLAVVATCQVQNVLSQLRSGNFGTEILTDTSQIAVLVASHCAKWTDFGFMLCFQLCCLQILMQLCRVVLSFKRGLHYGALFIFYFASFVWLFCYCCCLPLWIYLVATESVLEEDLQFGLITLLSALVLHLICATAFCPLFTATSGLFRRKPMREWLEASLFPNTDWKLTKLKKEISEEELSRQNSFKRHNAPKDTRNINQAKALMQVIRCSSLLKRKVKAMRERKESTESESSIEDASSSS